MYPFNTSAGGGKNLDSINPQKQPQVPPRITVSQGPAEAKRRASLLSSPRAPRGSAKKIMKFAAALIVIIILGLGGLLISRAANLSGKIFVGNKFSFFQTIRDFIRGGGDNGRLVGEDLGQINILLLGIGGAGHDGPYLTDTMILAEIRPDKKEISLVSVPRDYLASLPNNLGQQKINSAFAQGYALHKNYDEAGKWARQEVEKISGLDIPYFAVIDFSGFEEAINKVGGIDVHIDRTFTDYSYPNDATLGYLPPLTFTEGNEHMNGTRALQFARSRHAEGPEGSDFARSQRQQKILEAFKAKVLSSNIISDAGNINSLLDIFADHFHTNLSLPELLRVYNLTKSGGGQTIFSLSLDPETKIICPQILPDNGAYVLTPCQGKDVSDVQNFFKNSFAIGKLNQEKSVVWMAASAPGKTSYQAADKQLKDAGLTVWELPYQGQPLSQTVFYQLNPKPATAEFIKNTLNAVEVSLPPPGVKADKSKVDIIIILGQ